MKQFIVCWHKNVTVIEWRGEINGLIKNENIVDQFHFEQYLFMCPVTKQTMWFGAIVIRYCIISINLFTNKRLDTNLWNKINNVMIPYSYLNYILEINVIKRNYMLFSECTQLLWCLDMFTIHQILVK